MGSLGLRHIAHDAMLDALSKADLPETYLSVLLGTYPDVPRHSFISTVERTAHAAGGVQGQRTNLSAAKCIETIIH